MITVTKTKLPPLEKYIPYLEQIWAKGWVTNDGDFVKALEKKLEEHLKVKNLILVSNGTLALQLPLKALNLQGEIVTTPFTFAATTNAIIWEGLKPVFANIDPHTFNLDPDDVERKITPQTSAILAVHVYGNACDVDRLQQIANKYKIKLIYDAAHAFGVEHQDKPLVGYGDISTLSLHATKVFSTIEGGAIIAHDDEIYQKLKLLRNFGIEPFGDSILPGINAKMNEFQAAMGLCNLETLEGEIKSRQEISLRYLEKLSNLKDIQFQKLNVSKYNYAYLPVLFRDREQRDQIYDYLLANQIQPRKYFYPLTANLKHLQSENPVKKYQLQRSALIADRVLCLPLYADLAIKDVNKIIKLIKEVVS